MFWTFEEAAEVLRYKSVPSVRSLAKRAGVEIKAVMIAHQIRRVFTLEDMQKLIAARISTPGDGSYVGRVMATRIANGKQYGRVKGGAYRSKANNGK